MFSYALAIDYVRGPCLILCVRRGSCRLQIPMSVRHWSAAAALVAAPLAMLLAYRRWLLGADDAHLNADGKEYVRNRLMAEQQQQVCCMYIDRRFPYIHVSDGCLHRISRRSPDEYDSANKTAMDS